MAATHKIFSILAYALVEWILIIMLLFNSIFSYLIRKFATYNNLKPPCVWCSTIDHLFNPNNNEYQNLVCEAHATEFCNRYKCPDCQKTSTESIAVDRLFDSASKIKSNYEGNGMVPVDDKIKSPYIQVFDQIIPLEWTDSSTSCSISSCLLVDEDQVEDKEENVRVTIDGLMEELKAEKLVTCGLYVELDEERKASAVAANQAIAMITRLQEEKVALHSEYIQYQRMMDEQAEYDHEVLQLLNELVMKLEKDKLKLKNEHKICKEKVSKVERKTKAKTMPKCLHASLTKESLVGTKVLDSKNLREHGESVVEFEVERLWILDEILNEDHARKTRFGKTQSVKLKPETLI